MKRFLIISDIHACDVDPTASDAPSYVSSFGGRRTSADPLSELDSLIKKDIPSLDYILCPGDIANRANPSAFSYAWKSLNDLADKLKVPLIATVGNHDIDSRYKTNTFDPMEFAKNLTPHIPTRERPQYLEYWAENFTLIKNDDCNILVINTAAHHGAGRDATTEKDYGRISDSTLVRIADCLSSAPTASINIVLCHHHPLKTELTDSELKGLTRGGDKLIDLLNDSEANWIVVHGHKHIPDLFYGHGGSNAPVIVAAGSFGAQVNVDAKNKNPNQVHLLTCNPAEAAATGWQSAGSLNSWTWQPGIGWKRANGNRGLQHVVGFGYRASVSRLADEIDQLLTRNMVSQTSWQQALTAIPSLQRLVPIDFSAFEKALERKSLGVLIDRDGSLAQVGRLA